MSVGGARNTVETVGELDGLHDGVIGPTKAEAPPNITECDGLTHAGAGFAF